MKRVRVWRAVYEKHRHIPNHIFKSKVIPLEHSQNHNQFFMAFDAKARHFHHEILNNILYPHVTHNIDGMLAKTKVHQVSVNLQSVSIF